MSQYTDGDWSVRMIRVSDWSSLRLRTRSKWCSWWVAGLLKHELSACYVMSLCVLLDKLKLRKGIKIKEHVRLKNKIKVTVSVISISENDFI